MDITQKLNTLLKEHNGGAFLFIGSGFSRRYLGLEDWAGLLSKFCIDTPQSFKYYETSANGDLAKAASLLAEDFHNIWWNSDIYSEKRKMYEEVLENKTSPLRVEISHYLKNINLEEAFFKTNETLKQEIDLLSKLNISGIITTNWDLFLEYIFPVYTKFIGQQELLFSPLLESCEIYKIHGCASDPHSLILTHEDYLKFESKNSYLAAKLLTIFVEHPIIFIGYSLSDKNIQAILNSIVKCLSPSNLDKLRKNLIFIQRLKDNETEQLVDNTMHFTLDNENISLPITLIKTNDFSKIYNAIHQSHQNRFPVKLLRHFKEQIYQLDFSNSNKEKISVIDAEKIDNYDDVEFVIGVGIHERLGLSEHGYSGIEAKEILRDIIFDNKKYDAYKLLTLGFKGNFINKKNKYFPVFKYLRELNINSYNEYLSWKKEREQENIYLDKIDILIELKISDLQASKNQSQFHKNFTKYEFKNLDDILSFYRKSKDNKDTLNSILFYIPLLDISSFQANDLEELRKFLCTHQEPYLNKIETAIYCSAFKKLIVFYDKLKYGW